MLENLMRLGLGLSALAALTWLLSPSEDWSLDPEPAVAFLTTLVLWLVAESRSLLRGSAHPHEIEFVRHFRDCISQDSIRYLKQQDFGSTYNNERLDGFWRIDHESETPGYDPHDSILKKKFQAYKAEVRKFSLLLMSNGGPIGASASLSTIVPDRERAADEFSERTFALVKEVNAAADDVVSAYEQLMTAALRRVPEAFQRQL
jgi:hypothetical protein